MTATATPLTSPTVLPGAKDHFLETLAREHACTLRVMREFPGDQLEMKPGAKSNTARSLMWTFVIEQGMALKALGEGFDWSKPLAPMPEAPDSLEAIAGTFANQVQAVIERVKQMSDAELAETVSFPVAPKTIGNVPKFAFLWMTLCDQIHHRGQLSVYLRMAGAKVPSIYGPTADEPWM